MNIAMVSPYSWEHPGGVNNQVRGLAGEMLRRGHRITVVAPDTGDIPGARFYSAGLSVPVPANGSIAHLALLPGTGSRVRRALKSTDFDVVHVHEPLVPLVSTGAVRSSAGRVVGTFHAAGEGRSALYRLAGMRYRGIFDRLDCLIAVSQSAKSQISRYFPGDYRIIPNGIEITRFSPGIRRPSGFPPPSGPVILFVGRKERRKGLSVLLDAFGRVAQRVSGARLVVVGEGYGRGKLLPRALESLADRVTVTGYVSPRDLPAYYSAADVFCAPALGGESFGIILLEAMASGTAVVASDIQGYRDVLEKTGGGLLFEKGRPESLAETLIKVIEHEGLRRKLAAKGIEGSFQFSWKVLGDFLEACYRGMR